MQYARAGEILLARGWDLKLLYQSPQSDILIRVGIWDWVARRFVEDIGEWAHNVAESDM